MSHWGHGLVPSEEGVSEMAGTRAPLQDLGELHGREREEHAGRGRRAGQGEDAPRAARGAEEGPGLRWLKGVKKGII